MYRTLQNPYQRQLLRHYGKAMPYNRQSMEVMRESTVTIAAKAVYEGGVLKLSQPIPLAEGTHVEVIVISTRAAEKSSPSEILARIAALPMEGNSDEFSGRDYDRILYPPSDEP